ncbi:hypothetical protein PY093_19980 [Cytobacillus sp. S13-E01]|uniref:hypothetical protein n=1 Tax=Cytobacillus sp. S13-E01 TaxID=3031326 RepID=UPI0023D82BB1|nr:hypothetical protein [Cytobacillus sp. S13-E01]MDF0728895.1 hypothetical protein [Cytobacillus sp. S13-E01]
MNQLLIQVIKHNGFLKEIQKEMKLTNEEIEEGLKSLNLDTNPKRRLFCWEIQLLAEQMVYENSSVHNLDLNDLIVRHWNSTHALQVSRETISAFFERSLISNDKQKHAFNALSSGSLESYRVYSNEDPTLFSELLIRTLVYLVKGKEVKKAYNLILKHIFGDAAFQVGKKTLSRLDFYLNNGNVLLFNIEILVKNIPLETAVFADGMVQVLLPIVEELKNEEPVMHALSNTLREYKNRVVLDNQPEINSNTDTLETKGMERVLNKLVTIEPDTKEIETKKLSTQEEIIEYAKKIIGLSTQLRESEEETTITGTVGSEKLQELELENQRLYSHLERLQQEKEQLQYKKLFDLFEGIAGKKSQYLLSEIFDEINNSEEGTMLNGKVKNLFNYLRMSGIEPTTYGFDIGEELDITREALKDKFSISSPLTNEAEKVKIKILKRGWTIEGKTIIYPLVEEVVEMKQI